MTTATAIKPAEKINTIKGLLDRYAGEFKKALPKHVTVDRFMRVAFMAVRNNPALLDCTPESLISACMTAAQLGLEPDGILGHAYLVPFKNSRFNRTDAQFQVGYKGLIALARRSGEVRSIAAHVVCEQDYFDYAYGLEEKLEHKPAIGERGKPIAAYAVAIFKDGGHAFEVMSEADIEKIRHKSKAGDKDGKPIGIWAEHTGEMWRKTVIRRLAKYLPLSVEFQRAAAMDEAIDLGYDAASIAAIPARPALEESVLPAGTEPQKAVPPAPHEQEEAPPEKNNPNTVKGLIEEIETKSGTGKKGAWTKWIITVNGTGYNTFSETIAENAYNAKEAGHVVEIEFKDGGKYGAEIETFTAIIEKEEGVGDERF